MDKLILAVSAAFCLAVAGTGTDEGFVSQPPRFLKLPFAIHVNDPPGSTELCFLMSCFFEKVERKFGLSSGQFFIQTTCPVSPVIFCETYPLVVKHDDPCN